MAKTQKNLVKRLRNKYRLVILNDESFEEKISLKLSRLNVFLVVTIAAILLVGGTIFLIAFTPLREYIPETTKIIIAQRISSVQDADRILVMDGGTICNIGTHEELLKTSEIYREVYTSQNKGGDSDEK